MIRNAFIIFRNMLDEMLKSGKVINSLRPIATGVLDTSGSDSLWTQMVANDEVVVCLSRLPEVYFHPNVHHSIRLMCQELIDNKKTAYVCHGDKRFLIDSIGTPKGLTDEPESVKLQVHAAHTLLENL